MQIDLIWITREPNSKPEWSLGRIWITQLESRAVAQSVEKVLSNNKAAYCLFWNDGLVLPKKEKIEQMIRLPGDGWHAGLSLKTGGLPNMIDFVSPVWRFTKDPDPQIPATSWRISLNACLVKNEILKQLGGPDPAFDTLTGAGRNRCGRCRTWRTANFGPRETSDTARRSRKPS